MKLSIMQIVLGLAAVSNGLPSQLQRSSEHPLGTPLRLSTLAHLLGGDPACLSEGSDVRVCAGVDCGAAQACLKFGAGECMKIVLNSSDKCGAKGSYLNHNCFAKSTPNSNCGTRGYGVVDANGNCLQTSCSAASDACGEQRSEVELKPCDG